MHPLENNPEYRKLKLSSGVTLVSERHPRVASVSVGVWIKTGSLSEAPGNCGISHALEHMVFKGTETRTPYQIATLLESLGGELNAFTDREFTCFHATVLNEHLDVALDVLSDITLRPTFPKVEFERERGVLLQELAMIQETPEDRIHDVFFEMVWKDHALGRPIIGTAKTLKNMSRNALLKYWEEKYIPENFVISVCGNVEFEALRERCEHYFRFGKTKPLVESKRAKVKFTSRSNSVVQNCDQLHLLVGFNSIGYKDPFKYEALLLSMFLGGGMSSRLFQEIREKAGLAYSVDCEFLPFADNGLFLIYAGIVPKALKQCLEIIGKEVRSLLERPMSSEDLDRVKGQLKGMILLSSDQMEVRQESLGKNEIAHGRNVTIPEVIADIDRVTPERVFEFGTRQFTAEAESILTLSKVKPKAKGLTVLM